MLTEFLDFQRAVLARKAEGLSRVQLAHTTASSDLTLGGLIKHMAMVEDIWFTARFAGRPSSEPWASAPWDEDRDWELTSAADDEPSELFALFDAACARSRSIVASAESLAAVSAQPPDSGHQARNLRWILVHMIEEYARHVGHADLLRQDIDGQIGD